MDLAESRRLCEVVIQADELASELAGGICTPIGVTVNNAHKWVKLRGCGAEGARFLGMEEAAGSIPASSTKQ